MAENKKEDKLQGMGITDEQAKIFVDWIESKLAGDIICPVCKNTNWIAGEMILAPPARHPSGGVSIGGAIYPLIPIFCSNCGFTNFFNAVTVGLIDAKAEEPEKEEGAG